MGKVTDHLGNKYPSKKVMLAHYGISRNTFDYRYHKAGYSLERALTEPKKRGTGDLKRKKNGKISELLKEDIDRSLNYPENHICFSSYPGKEYMAVLKNMRDDIVERKQMIDVKNYTALKEEEEWLHKLKKTADKIDRLLMECSAQSFHIRFLDMLYAGKSDEVRASVDERTYQSLSSLLQKPEGIFKEIYINFVQFYKIGKTG